MDLSLLQDPLASWGAALLVFAASVAALYGVRYLLLCRLRAIAARTETKLDDFVVTVLSSTHTLSIWVVGIYLGIRNVARGPRRHPFRRCGRVPQNTEIGHQRQPDASYKAALSRPILRVRCAT
ncbi:hypothetical protein GCM10027321_01500 [Massilia terrae]|uniref:Uncharacterized protein n=1 Tax=Massilia terrae TaxID=1811224 RepID=A0ABT2CWL0_9BURK|nr:hypothetical protein [Massilia terrae]MCS0657488.1 hypothetical protein [Massilia terrae]